MIKRLLVLLGLSIVLTACPPVCDNPGEPVDLGPLSQEMLDRVPYLNGEEYHFKHNATTLVSFLANRATRPEQTYCEHGCCDTYIYRVNTTKLTTSYPIFSISLTMSNFENDNAAIRINVGNSGFVLLPDDATYDDVMVDGINYSDVYKLKQVNISDDNAGMLYVDSLYYQMNKGILKIKMSNNEYYDIDE